LPAQRHALHHNLFSPKEPFFFSDDWAGLLASGSNLPCTFPRQISWRPVNDQAGELPTVV
jgi:hypothetical protein